MLGTQLATMIDAFFIVFLPYKNIFNQFKIDLHRDTI